MAFVVTHVASGSRLRSPFVCCSVLQCVAVCCSVLQCVAVCCSVLRFRTLPGDLIIGLPSCVAVCVAECVAACCSVLRFVTLRTLPGDLIIGLSSCVAACVAVCLAACCGSCCQRAHVDSISFHSSPFVCCSVRYSVCCSVLQRAAVRVVTHVFLNFFL